jgi:hypothetical protein
VLASIVRQLGPAAILQDDLILTNSLWAIATVSAAPMAHMEMLREGMIDLLVGVLEKAVATTHCDYALSALLQLTAREECRQLMVTYNAHLVLAARMTCGVPSVVRRALQVLANLCVDEASRTLIAGIPRLFETVLASLK